MQSEARKTAHEAHERARKPRKLTLRLSVEEAAYVDRESLPGESRELAIRRMIRERGALGPAPVRGRPKSRETLPSR